MTSQEQRNKIWRNYFGTKNEGVDFAGRKITKDGDWTEEHIMPSSIKRDNSYENVIPSHRKSNENKADYNTWSDGDYTYQVKNGSKQEGYYHYIIFRKSNNSNEWTQVTPSKLK
ncbi:MULTISPECIES: HNH endonuclease domain-containing protein [unclassified Mycoplasma]|uniref:HNH endonuclease domain-containing protein n=1 Tax=unclassified Mycoplasma TaxID=2683645 RepID=UPI00197C62E8|nr:MULTISPECIES: HNH endonuclease domain-containing protein [unclassified Mycoplasma]MBN4084642.1 hypothetical protein [Mycoplasma sp. CSL10166]MBU4693120.1 hypothetical protein [Mycoplasma sp. CSL7491-lung]